MDTLYIEDTDDWLGCPTPLETCRHQLLMCENEIQELTAQLRQERERIFKLVEINETLLAQKLQADAGLKKATADVARLQSERSELLMQVKSMSLVSSQRDHLFDENQRLLREASERQR